jgi:protein-tyrosine-phosphatase
MKILFLCRHNRFRSQVANTIFKKLNENKKFSSDSAGIVIDDSRSYIANNVLKIMHEFGYEIHDKPKRIDYNLINNYDLLVIVANNVKIDFFSWFKGDIIKWNIPDCNENNTDKIKEVILIIEDRVKDLLNTI